MIDEALAAVMRAELAPLAAEIRELRGELEALRAVSPSQWVSVARAAELLGVSTQTIPAMAGRGEIVIRHAGRRVLVDVASLRGHSRDEIAAFARRARS